MSYKVPACKCPKCGKANDRATGEANPKPGDLSVCAYCLQYLQFNQALEIEVLTEQSFLKLDNDTQQQMQRIAKMLTTSPLTTNNRLN